MDAFRVLPNICRPFECLDSLNILNTRTNRITRRMAKDIAWFWLCWFGITGGLGAISSSFSATIVARVIKYGMMATRSIMFMMSLLNSILLGHARNLTKSSNVNQMMHNVSTMKNGSVTSGTWKYYFDKNVWQISGVNCACDRNVPHPLRLWCHWQLCWKLYNVWTQAASLSKISRLRAG